jgi:DHA2 family multidrug resistance protein-like MFS transporter
VSETPPHAGRKEWIGLFVLALPCLIYSMDLMVLNLAVPKLTESLHPTSVQLLWIVDIYGFLVAGSLITMGTLGDRIGRRRLLLSGAAGFAIASLIAAFATSAPMLIFARALLGIAGGTIAPSTLSLIRNMFHDPGERTKAISVWGTAYAAGGIVGPLAGGVLLEYFWWGSVFLIAIPVMVLLLVVGPRLIPEYRNPENARLDILSAAMATAAVLTVIYGLKQMAQDGLGWPPVLFIAAGLAIGALFVRREFTLADPLLDLRLFARRGFSAALATNILGIFAVFGSFLYVAQYMQLMLGLSPLTAALWMLPSALVVTAGSMLAPMIAARAPPAFVAAGGLTVCAAGYGFLTFAGAHLSLPLIVTGSVVMSLGLGPIFIVTTDIIVGTAPPERAGAAAAISETGAEFGGVLGIAILGSIGTAVYRGAIAAAIPAGTPAAAATAARDTLGGAAAAAADLPGQAGEALLSVAREAFGQSFGVVVALCGLLALVAAIIAATLLRNLGTPASRAESADA